MDTIKIFNYNEVPVTFKLGDTTMINATEMAKPFGLEKRPQFWLTNQQTKEFLSEFSKARILALTDLVQVTKGGSNPGTWMHEDVALEFARWLSPLFAIWCNDRIKELLRIGTTTINVSAGSYDVSRNILSGVHSPQTKMIGGQAILIIHSDDMLYYRLKDILLAAGVYERKRKDTSESWFKPYVYWLNDQTGNRAKRYVTENGVLVILSKTRATDDRLPSFLNDFTSWTETEKRVAGDIDLKKFLDVIISIPDNDSRNFLYNLYKKLKAQ
jgi:hypothetical protein